LRLRRGTQSPGGPPLNDPPASRQLHYKKVLGLLSQKQFEFEWNYVAAYLPAGFIAPFGTLKVCRYEVNRAAEGHPLINALCGAIVVCLKNVDDLGIADDGNTIPRSDVVNGLSFNRKSAK
jgi:hypothetical protein